MVAAAGLRPGEQNLSINRNRRFSHPQLVSELRTAAQADGNTVIVIRRNGQTQQLNANLMGAARNTAAGNVR